MVSRNLQGGESLLVVTVDTIDGSSDGGVHFSGSREVLFGVMRCSAQIRIGENTSTNGMWQDPPSTKAICGARKQSVNIDKGTLTDIVRERRKIRNSTARRQVPSVDWKQWEGWLVAG